LEGIVVRNFVFACILASAVSGCGSITVGSSQEIGVDTVPDPGAECTLSNEKGHWNIPKTPGSTAVTKAYSPLVTVCKHPNGATGTTSVVSTTAGATFGNIVAGGVIGAAVDMSTGAAYSYPAKVTVTLSRTEAQATPQETAKN